MVQLIVGNVNYVFGGTKGVGLEVLDVWGKQVLVLDKKKTEAQECKLNGMLEYHFDEKMVCKAGVYSYGKLF